MMNNRTDFRIPNEDRAVRSNQVLIGNSDTGGEIKDISLSDFQVRVRSAKKVLLQYDPNTARRRRLRIIANFGRPLAKTD
jgi:hypothetical protein